MGRARTQYYGSTQLPRDRGKPGNTEQSLTTFADSSLGPVASMLWTQDLLAFDAEGELRVSPSGVRAAVENLKATVVSTREYDKATFTGYAVEATGLTPKRALNATDREFKAKAQAVLLAAKAADVPISPADKRILNPLAEGRFLETVYGKKGQYEEGTLVSRAKARRTSGGWRDSGYQARARELRDQLREYRYEAFVA